MELTPEQEADQLRADIEDTGVVLHAIADDPWALNEFLICRPHRRGEFVQARVDRIRAARVRKHE